MLRVATEAFVEHSATFSLLNEKTISRSSDLLGHYAPSFGVICGVLSISVQITRLLFLRCVVRDMLSSATRLSVVGPLEGVRLQVQLIPVIVSMLKERAEYKNRVSVFITGSAINDDDTANSFLSATQTAPMLDMLQARHEMLYTRLFNS